MTSAADLRIDDLIESALRRDAADHASVYIDDDGFTARVMAQLPPAMQPVPRWRKPAVAVLWGVAAAGAGAALPGVALEIGREAFRLLAGHPVSLPQIASMLALFGFATWSAAAVALRNN